MNRLGIGLAAVARPAYITSGRVTDLGELRAVEQLRERTRAVLDTAYDLGTRYIDVARSYGRSEEFLAGWLGSHPEIDDVRIGSKWGYRYVGDWRLDAPVHEIKDHSAGMLAAQLAETTALLGDRLERYHIHSATPESGVLADAEVLDALARLRDRGFRVGLSTSGPAQAATVRAAIAVRRAGRPLFTSVQTTWNVLETAAGPALAEAAQAGADVIVKEPVANGRLVPGGAAPDDRRAARVAELADAAGMPVDQLAIAAALARPWARWVLSGAVTPEQLRSNAAAVDRELPDDLLAELDRLAEPPAAYWAARSARPWA